MLSQWGEGRSSAALPPHPPRASERNKNHCSNTHQASRAVYTGNGTEVRKTDKDNATAVPIVATTTNDKQEQLTA